MISVAGAGSEQSLPTCPKGVVSLLRVAADALSASSPALPAPLRETLRVLAKHGLEPEDEARLIALLAEALREAESRGGEAPVGPLRAAGPPCGLPQVAIVPLRQPGEQGPGALAATDDSAADERNIPPEIIPSAAGQFDAGISSVAAEAGDHGAIRDMADALEALPEAIAVFDRDGRFVFWNRRFEETYACPGAILRRGLRFDDHLKACLAEGHVVAAKGREEAWLAERLGRFQAAEGAHEHQLGDGRWVRVQDRLLAHGGRVGIRSDITELVDRERSFRLLFDANQVPMIVLDRLTLRILAANDAAVAFYGVARQAFLELELADIRPERVAGENQAMILRLHDPALADETQIHRTGSGEERIVKVSARVLDHAGRPAVLVAIFDVTERQRMEDEVREARAFLKDVVDQIPAAMFVRDMWADGRYVIFNRACETLAGRAGTSILGQSDAEVFGSEGAERLVSKDHEAFRLGRVGTVDDEILHRPDGAARSIHTRRVTLEDARTGEPRYVLGVCEDVTDRRADEARIAYMAHHDALTGLPNRFLLADRLEAALARLPGSSEALAVLCIDLDGFKAVNDRWGHAVGDRLLCAVGDRLRGAIRAGDALARLGGDEFVVLQAPVLHVREAAWLAGRLVSMLSKPFDIDGRTLRISGSLGISLGPSNGMDGTVLLEKADAALYEAKRQGRNRFRFADPGLNVHSRGGRGRSKIA